MVEEQKTTPSDNSEYIRVVVRCRPLLSKETDNGSEWYIHNIYIYIIYIIVVLKY